jgi:hypothetical protein
MSSLGQCYDRYKEIDIANFVPLIFAVAGLIKVFDFYAPGRSETHCSDFCRHAANGRFQHAQPIGDRRLRGILIIENKKLLENGY